MRLRGSVPSLSSCDEQQDRVRRLSRERRSLVAVGDNARRRFAGSRKAQRLGSHAEGKVSGPFGCGARRGGSGLLLFPRRLRVTTQRKRQNGKLFHEAQAPSTDK